MKNQISNFVRINSETIFASDPTYAPISINKLTDIQLYELPLGVEIIPYNQIINNHFTIDGLRISLKKEYETRVVIGCVEFPEYLIAEGSDLDNLFCCTLIDRFLLRLNTKISLKNHIAA